MPNPVLQYAREILTPAEMVDSANEVNSLMRPPTEPANDEVFPSEIYATAEPGWGRLSTNGPEGEIYFPQLQPNLDNIQGERRVAIYVLKEVKHLKIRRELV